MTDAQNRHRMGLMLTALAALAWSSSGLFTRLISADLLTMLFWRGLASGTVVMCLTAYLEGNNFFATLRAIRWPSLAVMVFSAAGMFCGIGAMRYTNVAEAMVIYGTAPFMTAGLAYLILGEKPSRSTLLASAVALFGIVVMVSGSAGDGNNFGRLLAFGMALSMAGLTIVLRSNRDVQMLPAMGMSAWLCAAVSFCFASTLTVSMQDFWLCIAFGVVQNAAGLALYTLGSKRIQAAEATLIAALEVPLTPLWVLFFLGETPNFYTIIGGTIVLTALFAHIGSQLRTRQASLVT